MGSGNVVHNLGLADRSQPATGFDWAYRFDEDAAAIMRDRPSDVLELAEHADFDLAVPTPDHFIPSLHVAGLAAASGEAPATVAAGCVYGSLSMTCTTLGVDCDPSDVAEARHESEPVAAPADESNI